MSPSLSILVYCQTIMGDCRSRAIQGPACDWADFVALCVDHTTVPSGKLIVRGCEADLMFFVGVPFNTKIKIAPVSAIACVGGISGFFGCIIMPHILFRLFTFDVMTVLSSSSTTIFWVGYKVGLEPNDVTHLTSTCSAPQCQLGNWLLCIAFVHASYPAAMYLLV